MDEVLDIFREEAREHLGALEKGFLDLEDLETPTERRPLIDNLFRHAHSVKGDARAVGVEQLQQSSQELEDTLDEMREDPARVGKPEINLALTQLDRVRAAFESWEQGHGLADETPAALAASEQKNETDAGVTVEAAAASTVTELPDSDIRDQPSEIESSTRTVPASAATSSSAGESFTVRVPSERLDRMLNLAGELRVAQRAGHSVISRLRDLNEFVETLLDRAKHVERNLKKQSVSGDHTVTGKTEPGRTVSFDRDDAIEFRQQIESAHDQIQRVANALRRSQSRDGLLVVSLEADIRQARLLPLVMLTDTLRRTVRELGQSLGKSIRYEVDVGSIMVDKVVIEALKDPLQHLIRNAADHGLEMPDERVAAGKSESGTIHIAASQRGELVRITVSDDGRGVDYDRVRTRIRELGLSDVQRINELSESEIASFLFHPGFSTAPAGRVSGRGVGLDVVRDTVQRLQGTVEIISHRVSSDADQENGGNTDRKPKTGIRKSTEFVIHVPVTVSTVRILTVSAGGQFYGISTTGIIRTGRIRRDELRELEGCPVLLVEGEPIRWVHLSDLLELPTLHQTASEHSCSYVLLGENDRKTAVAVDDLEDESEVLLKPLEFPLSRLPGIVGATVRPDGTVQIVLDPVVMAVGRGRKASRLVPAAETVVGRILIADDSPTTRTIIRNLLSAAGYAVITASDGIEALERLRSQPVDLVVSDVEMPRLNGIDLARQIKSQFGYPVILVTGREKEQHRREGLEAGADAYVVKSTFEGEGLLDIVRQFV